MIGDATSLKVYLAPGVTDMRKSIDGLSLIASEVLNLDPFSESLFVFCNRGRNKLKILHWQTNGFWLYYRRLEKGCFNWPGHGNPNQAITLTRRELNWLLDGLPVEQKKRTSDIALSACRLNVYDLPQCKRRRFCSYNKRHEYDDYARQPDHGIPSA